MTSLIAKLGLAALVALTGLSATAPTAAAANGVQPLLVQYHQVQYHDRDRDWRHHDRRDRHDRRRHHGRREGCAPWLAEQKADRMGLRRTRVVDISRRTVTVVGFDRRGRDRVVFANVRGCPLIRR
jgi:hypothetical protein